MDAAQAGFKLRQTGGANDVTGQERPAVDIAVQRLAQALAIKMCDAAPDASAFNAAHGRSGIGDGHKDCEVIGKEVILRKALYAQTE
jgi:hypothetical protein